MALGAGAVWDSPRPPSVLSVDLVSTAEKPHTLLPFLSPSSRPSFPVSAPFLLSTSSPPPVAHSVLPPRGPSHQPAHLRPAVPRAQGQAFAGAWVLQRVPLPGPSLCPRWPWGQQDRATSCLWNRSPPPLSAWPQFTPLLNTLGERGASGRAERCVKGRPPGTDTVG